LFPITARRRQGQGWKRSLGKPRTRGVEQVVIVHAAWPITSPLSLTLIPLPLALAGEDAVEEGAGAGAVEGEGTTGTATGGTTGIGAAMTATTAGAPAVEGGWNEPLLPLTHFNISSCCLPDSVVPACRSPSPRRGRSRSPPRRSPPPRRSRSPAKRSRSPAKRSRSPVKVESSPPLHFSLAYLFPSINAECFVQACAQVQYGHQSY